MNKKNNNPVALPARLLLAMVVPVLVLALYNSDVLKRLSLIGYDMLFELRGEIAVDNSIVLVKQDKASTDYFNIRLSDWPRRYHGTLIEKLTAAGADLIVFDYDFSRPTNKNDDDAMARAIAEAGNVILANRLLPSGLMAQPLAEFSENSLGEGFFDTILDKDGYWRRMIYSNLTRDGYVYFSLPMTTVEIYEDFPESQRALNNSDVLGWGQHNLPFPDMLINFAGPDGSYPSISYFKILQENFDPSTVKGKIVLVGNTHRLGKDFFSVPTGKKMSGLEVHANAIATILNDSFIQPLSALAINLLIIVAGIAGGLILFLRQADLRMNLLLMFTGCSVIFLTSWYFFVFQLVWIDLVPLLQVFLLNISVAAGYQWRQSRQREKEIRGLFGHYVSKNVVDALLSEKTPVRLDGHRTEVSILFSDIRGFTSLSESLTPAELGQLLNQYFDEMIAAVFQYDGTLDKLMGDAVMAFFGSPLQSTNHAQQACRCAAEMIRRLAKLNASGSLPDDIRIEIGIGIHSGEAIVGNLGSSEFADYTVIGDAVNLASRIEGLNKQYHTTIIISGDTQSQVQDECLCRELDTVRVKGKDEANTIYELLTEDTPLIRQNIATYESALQYYRAGRWNEAIAELEQNMPDTDDNGPSQRLINRCRSLLSQPSAENWTAITTLDDK